MYFLSVHLFTKPTYQTVGVQHCILGLATAFQCTISKANIQKIGK